MLRSLVGSEMFIRDMCGEEFLKVCRLLFGYQYTKEGMDLSDSVLEWLYEHSGGNLSVLVALLHDAQETAILS